MWQAPSDLIYRIVTKDSADIQIGQIVYFQQGVFGAPIGILLSLTKTPLFIKMIKTSNGLMGVN